MNKSVVSGIMLGIFLASILGMATDIHPITASDGAYLYIYIRSDGSIDPPEAKALIDSSDLVTYTIYGDIINKSIIVEKDNIVINGYNHLIQGNSSLRAGINLTGRKDVTIDSVRITKFSYGVLLNNTADCNLYRNTLWDNWAGIWVENTLRARINYNNASHNNFGTRILSSGNNDMYYNTLFSNVYGILEWYSIADTIVGNNASFNWNSGIYLYACGGGTLLINNNASENISYGICLYESDNIRMNGNIMSGNQYNFGIDGTDHSEFATHTIDATNMVDGKPIYYIKGESDTVYDASTNAGTVYLINCANVTVKDLNLASNICGAFMWNTTQSKVENVSIVNNYYGIRIRNSGNNTVLGNLVAENCYGLKIENSRYIATLQNDILGNQYAIHANNSKLNIIYRNTIGTSMNDGIHLEHSHNNTIIKNTIKENGEFDPIPLWFGINLLNSENNTIYHNNFIDNIEQANAISSNNNKWDNGWPSGGNYWSDHTNIDTNSDGIADNDYAIDILNIDANPLAGAFSFLETPLGYTVEILCNSTIDSLAYRESDNAISIAVSNMTSTQTHGFCRLTIPHSLIPPEYQVIINGTPTTPILVLDNGTHSVIYVSYEHSTIQLIVVPEHSLVMLMLLLLFTTTLTILFKKKQAHQKT